MDAAENTAMSHQDDPVIRNFKYYNAKEMLGQYDNPPNITITRSLDDRSLKPVEVPLSVITLEANSHFYGIEVNTSLSSVHIPTNVFDRSMFICFLLSFTYGILKLLPIADEVLKAIQWSEKLDSIFLNNYQKDPTLSWQFFGSSTGFMRQFPGT